MSTLANEYETMLTIESVSSFNEQHNINDRNRCKVAVKRMHKFFSELMDAKHIYREMHILR